MASRLIVRGPFLRGCDFRHASGTILFCLRLGTSTYCLRSLWISKTGLDAQQTQLDVISNNLANVAPTASSARTPCSRTCCTRTCASPARRRSQQTQLPSGLQVGTGVRAGRHRAHLHPGQPAADRQPARRGDQRRRLLPGADARRHHRLHARRLVPGRRQGQLVTSSGYTVQPGITDPGQRAERDHRPRRHGHRVTQPGQRRRRPGRHSCSWRASSTRRACEPKGENLYVETAASGTPNAGTPGTERRGHRCSRATSRPPT